MGYLEAIVVALPLGFALGLSTKVRAMTERLITSFRFLPLSTLTGLFIAWFGIGSEFRVQFLAFGIFVYLLPVVVQRIDEVEEVYLQTIQTLGATKWQAIRRVYIPSVLSRISDDARVLVAISWTYIIIAEVINTSDGGIGALAYMAGRQSRVDKVFALLVVIVLIGFLQDKIFRWADRKLFKFKHLDARQS
jgi:NitT/TauT family transport system permease protein